MDVTFLYWEDCLSHEEALQRLRQVMAEGGLALRCTSSTWRPGSKRSSCNSSVPRPFL